MSRLREYLGLDPQVRFMGKSCVDQSDRLYKVDSRFEGQSMSSHSLQDQSKQSDMLSSMLVGLMLAMLGLESCESSIVHSPIYKVSLTYGLAQQH